MCLVRHAAPGQEDPNEKIQDWATWTTWLDYALASALQQVTLFPTHHFQELLLS